MIGEGYKAHFVRQQCKTRNIHTKGELNKETEFLFRNALKTVL